MSSEELVPTGGEEAQRRNGESDVAVLGRPDGPEPDDKGSTVQKRKGSGTTERHEGKLGHDQAIPDQASPNPDQHDTGGRDDIDSRPNHTANDVDAEGLEESRAAVDSNDEEPEESRHDAVSNVSFGVGAVARHLGIAPATLRTWDRRYGLGPSSHATGAHRRYAPTDIERLAIMRRLTAEGVATSEAARVARESDVAAAAAASPFLGLTQFRPSPPAPTRPPDPESLAQAARERNLTELTRQLHGEQPLETWWTDLVEPALDDLKNNPVVAWPGNDPIETFRSAALDEVRRRMAALPVLENPRVLLVKAGGQGAPLVLHVLAGALRQAGIGVGVLPGEPSTANYVTAIRGLSPLIVVVVADQRSGNFDAVAALHEVADPPLTFLVQLSPLDVPVPTGPNIERMRTFSGALHEIVAVVRAAR